MDAIHATDTLGQDTGGGRTRSFVPLLDRLLFRNLSILRLLCLVRLYRKTYVNVLFLSRSRLIVPSFPPEHPRFPPLVGR